MALPFTHVHRYTYKASHTHPWSLKVRERDVRANFRNLDRTGLIAFRNEVCMSDKAPSDEAAPLSPPINQSPTLSAASYSPGNLEAKLEAAIQAQVVLRERLEAARSEAKWARLSQCFGPKPPPPFERLKPPGCVHYTVVPLTPCFPLPQMAQWPPDVEREERAAAEVCVALFSSISFAERAVCVVQQRACMRRALSERVHFLSARCWCQRSDAM